jgi:AcrR family transcriptional regulator
MNRNVLKPGCQKAKMLEIARRLFWEKGYNATSMREIAVSYGCRPANIYNFFSDKEEILFEVLREEMEQIINPIKHLEEEDGSSPIEQLKFIIESHLKVTLSYRRSAKLLFDVALDNLSPDKRKKIVDFRDTYDRIIRKVIHRGIDTGHFPEVDAKLAGFMIASMITRTRIWFHSEQGVSASELSDFIFKFVFNGLRGREREEKGGEKNCR